MRYTTSYVLHKLGVRFKSLNYEGLRVALERPAWVRDEWAVL